MKVSSHLIILALKYPNSILIENLEEYHKNSAVIWFCVNFFLLANQFLKDTVSHWYYDQNSWSIDTNSSQIIRSSHFQLKFHWIPILGLMAKTKDLYGQNPFRACLTSLKLSIIFFFQIKVPFQLNNHDDRKYLIILKPEVLHYLEKWQKKECHR